jgi:hypothetical protein
MKPPPVYFEVFSPPALSVNWKASSACEQAAYAEAYEDLFDAFRLGEPPCQVQAVLDRLLYAHAGFEEGVFQGALRAAKKATQAVAEVTA